MKCVSENLFCDSASANVIKGKPNNEWRLLWIKPCEAGVVVAVLKAEILVSALKSAKNPPNPQTFLFIHPQISILGKACCIAVREIFSLICFKWGKRIILLLKIVELKSLDKLLLTTERAVS